MVAVAAEVAVAVVAVIAVLPLAERGIGFVAYGRKTMRPAGGRA